MASGAIQFAFKIVGQRSVLGVIDIDSHDDLDRIWMAQLPMAHVLEVDELLPVREYSAFAGDVRGRWGLREAVASV